MINFSFLRFSSFDWGARRDAHGHPLATRPTGQRTQEQGIHRIHACVVEVLDVSFTSQLASWSCRRTVPPCSATVRPRLRSLRTTSTAPRLSATHAAARAATATGSSANGSWGRCGLVWCEGRVGGSDGASTSHRSQSAVPTAVAAGVLYLGCTQATIAAMDATLQWERQSF